MTKEEIYHALSNLHEKMKVIKRSRKGAFTFMDDYGCGIDLNNIDKNKLKSIVIEDFGHKIERLEEELKEVLND